LLAGIASFAKAAFYSNGKIKPNILIIGKDAPGSPKKETHPEGAYYLYLRIGLAKRVVHLAVIYHD